MGLALLLVIRLSVGADHLVSGEGGARTSIALQGPAGVPLHLAVNVGQIERASSAASTTGHLEASYIAPSEPYPQVAVIAAWNDAGEAAMAVLPLWGSARLPIAIDEPFGAVTLLLGRRQFHAQADGQGRAEIAFTAPPGVAQGIVHVVDRVGNVRTRDVPLGIPDAPRLLLELVPDEVVADGKHTSRVLAFAATAGGEPELQMRFLEGREWRAAQKVAPGVFAYDVQARRKVGLVTVSASGAGQALQKDIGFVAGPPASIEAVVQPDGGGAGECRIVARVLDEVGHVLPVAPTAELRTGMPLPFEPATGGGYVARYRPGAQDPVDVTLRAGAVQKRVSLRPVAAEPRWRWEVRGLFVSNGTALAGGGVLAGLSARTGPWLQSGVQVGLLAEGGQGAQGPADASPDVTVLALPLRLQVGGRLGRGAALQPFWAAHGGFMWVRAQASASASGAMPIAASSSDSEAAADVGAELGLLWRLGLGGGGVALTAGYCYAPIVSGALISGSVDAIEVGIGWRSGL